MDRLHQLANAADELLRKRLARQAAQIRRAAAHTPKTRQWNCDLVEQKIRDFVPPTHSKGRPINMTALNASMWCIRQRMQNPRLELKQALEMVKKVPKFQGVVLPENTLRNHVQFITDQSWRNLCSEKQSTNRRVGTGQMGHKALTKA